MPGFSWNLRSLKSHSGPTSSSSSALPLPEVSSSTTTTANTSQTSHILPHQKAMPLPSITNPTKNIPPPPPYTHPSRVSDKKVNATGFFGTSPGATYSSATSTVSAAAAAIFPFYTLGSRSSSFDSPPSSDENGEISEEDSYIVESCDGDTASEKDQYGGSRKPIKTPAEYVIPVNNLIDTVAIQAAVGFSSRALMEEHRGNRASATDLYLTALENMLLALPVAADNDRRNALQQKISEYMHHTNMTLQPVTAQTDRANTNSMNGPKVSDTVISVAVKAAVAFKQSPLPDLLSAAAHYTFRKAQQVDEMFGVQEKAWQVGKSAINKGIELDREYHVHHKLADAVFVGAAALLKASIAYKDAKPYRELYCMDRDGGQEGR